MNAHTTSVLAALSLSAALLAASPASAVVVDESTSPAPVLSPRMAERLAESAQGQRPPVVSPRVAERTATAAATTAKSTTMSPRVAERLGSSERRVVSLRMAERGHE